MPYPRQVDSDAIIEQARQLITEQGVDALTLGKLARRLGVQAPSLYRHVGNKAELLRAINMVTLTELFAGLHEAGDVSAEPEPRFIAVAHALRRYAHANPQLYMLAFTTPDERPDENLLIQMVLPFQAMIAAIAGQENSLAALRGALALIHGFVMLELNRQLQRGGDLDAAFEQSLIAFLAGWRVLHSAEIAAQPTQLSLNI